jgi:group I intron endonuclease
MVGIYKIENLVNGKRYYGSSKNIDKRWSDHKNQLRAGKHGNYYLQRAWVKYGEDKFSFEIIEECMVETLLEREQHYLNMSPEYNIGNKSSGGDNLSKNPKRNEIIDKMSNSIRKRYDSMTEQERKEKHSQPMNENPNWKGGASIRFCEECGVRISQGANRCKDHIVYDRQCEKNPFFGKNHSEETKKKMSENRKGKKPTNMKKVTIDNIIYESLAEASLQTGVPAPTILWRIKSKNKKYENYQSHPTIKAYLSN